MNITKAKQNLLAHLHLLPSPVQEDVKFLLETFDATIRELEELKANAQPLNNVENLPNEIWRDVIGYEGLYMVSNMGRLKSNIWNGGRLINPCLHTGGYLIVGLYKNGRRKIYYVHVLVAQAFIANSESKSQVNHIDADKTNNRVENLEWVTQKENIRHSWQLGLRRCIKGTANKNSKLQSEKVRYIRAHYIPRHREFGASALARKFSVDPETILNVIKYKTYKDVV